MLMCRVIYIYRAPLGMLSEKSKIPNCPKQPTDASHGPIVRDLHSPEHRMGGLGFPKSAVGDPPVGSPIPMNKNCRL
jgi:hypothetical protein